MIILTVNACFGKQSYKTRKDALRIFACPCNRF